MFNDLLNWDLEKVKRFIEFLSLKKGNIVFSSEINNYNSDKFFTSNFNTYDFIKKKYYHILNGRRCTTIFK